MPSNGNSAKNKRLTRFNDSASVLADMKNKTKYKSLNRYENDCRVVSIYSEEDSDDGLWADLAKGYVLDGCTSVHAWSVTRLMDDIRRVKQVCGN